MKLQTWRTRLQIEKFVYEKGTNVALYNVEHSKQYQRFEKQTYNALFAQIQFIADYKDKLPLLMALAKAASDSLLSQVGTLIATKSVGDGIDLEAYLIWAGTQGGQAALDKLGISGVFGLKNIDLVNYFAHSSNLIINSVDKYTKEWIANKIQAGKDNGLTPFEIQKSLIDSGKDISAIRAERIVLTETAQAMKLIEIETVKRLGVKELIWRTSRDERVCPICMPLEGKRSIIGKSLFPGAFDGPPGHVSCRCYIEEVIPTDFEIPGKVWLGD